MGGGGQSGRSTTINQATPAIAPELSPLVTQSANLFSQAQQQSPSLATLLQGNPQQIPGQTPLEQFLSSLQIGMAAPGPASDQSVNALRDLSGGPTGGSSTTTGAEFANAPEVASLHQLAQLTGGPIGSSPVTREGIAALEQQYQTETLPSIQNQLMLAGLGNSGALGESLARARSGVSAATVPLLQQEVQNRTGSVNALQSLGQTLAQRQAGTTATALQTAGTPRDIETQQLQARFLDQQRIQALIEQLVMGPLNIFGPSLVGQVGQTMQRGATRGSGILGALAGGGAK